MKADQAIRVVRVLLRLPRLLRRLNVVFYASNYPDLSRFTDRQLRIHWFRHGWREGRFPSWSLLRFSARIRRVSPRKIDFLSYLAANPDMAVAGYWTLLHAASHFIYIGHRQPERPQGIVVPEGFAKKLRNQAAADPWRANVSEDSRKEPRWDRRARRDFESPLEEFFSAVPIDSFVVSVYEEFLGYVPPVEHLHGWLRQVDYQMMTYSAVLACVAGQEISAWWAAPPASRKAAGFFSPHDALRVERAGESLIQLMGEEFIDIEEWKSRAFDALEVGHEFELNREALDLNVGKSKDAKKPTKPEVSVICSVYNPGSFLESFLRNIEEQSIFLQAEIIIIAVELSTAEKSLVRQFASAHTNVIVEEFEHRIGIYEAWNRAARLASAPFLTNMNVDDLRRHDSLEIQRDALVQFPSIDVVYQDVLLTLSRKVSWQVIEKVGVQTTLPIAGEAAFFSHLNPPHNAPMWRKSLHDRIGYFREDFRSASDVDFWIRASLAGSLFLCGSHPHAAYYLNPTGLSTDPTGAGQNEHRKILTQYKEN